MCRLLVYKGSDEILLSKLIIDPTHSILKQSYDARLRLDTRRGQNNADGFGIGFYTDPKLGQTPCLFRSTIPVWNCANLERIATKTASRLVFAHVRAATDGSLSEDNCHPFSHGSLMWMHNGGLGGWKYIKRRLSERLADKWYHVVVGGTDSEWAFALFLDTLERMGCDPSSQPETGFGPGVLRRAMLRTIAIINELIDQIPESIILAENVDTRSLLNFVVADGHSVICTRYISSATDQAASLYYSSGSQWEKLMAPGEKDYHMQRRDKGADVVLVASEPLTFERENWVNVPTNSILTIHGQTVMVHPILDEYSSPGPAHSRSAAFVQTKGLVANEKLSLSLRPGITSPSSTPSSLPSSTSPSVPAAEVAKPPKNKMPSPAPPVAATQTAQAVPATRTRSPEHAHTSTGRPRIPYGSMGGMATGGGLSASHGPTATQLNGGPSMTSPRLGRQSSTGSPVQGNIKKKRRSLSELEQSHAIASGYLDAEPPTPTTPIEPPRNSFGDPNKIAQFFPELGTIGTVAT